MNYLQWLSMGVIFAIAGMEASDGEYMLAAWMCMCNLQTIYVFFLKEKYKQTDNKDNQ